MSYMLGHLHNGWQVDQAILSEEDRVVVSRLFRLRNKYWFDSIRYEPFLFIFFDVN